MMLKVIHTEKAPQAIGAYSQAIEFDKMVFLSGQIPLNPETGQVCSENFVEQVHQVFQNCREVCRAAGGDLHQIIKLTIYVTDMNNFQYVNEVMIQYFNAPYPARAVVGVQALPRNVQIEIEAIMAK
jgi:reactive intermediate/imine deaminase